MYNRFLQLPLNGESSIFLFGPRGTGKTSWIKAMMKDALYIDLLEFSSYTLLSSQPDRLEALIPPNYKGWIVIDEVQRIPELLNTVHRLIENRKLRFLLTGSSARNLRKQGVNLLAGRALRYTMHPLIPQELGIDFKIERALMNGLLPMAINHQDSKRYLESYVQAYIKEEVMQEGLTRNIGAFSRFLEVASFSQGSVLNMSEIARELAMNRLVVANYFDILEDLLIAIRIPVFAKRAKRKVIAHQKFYFFDAGVYRVLRPTGPLDTPQEIDGAGLETLFLQVFRAINDYNNLGYELSFWQTTQGQEVDFIAYGSRGLLAFEIKRTAVITSKMLKSLRLFSEEYPESKLYLLYFGKHIEYHGNITVMPFEKALLELPELLT